MGSSNILYNNCHPGWPSAICAFANVCGLLNTIIWFLVFLPQIYRNFRHRTVQGLSPYWIIANFTASLNNAFFAFKYGNLPVFVKISGCYAPVIQGILLFQFVLFTKYSHQKVFVSILCLVVWLTFTFLQIFLNVYDWMQWITVVLWGIGSYPQVILCMARQSTQGLSVAMILLRVCSVYPWFCSMYLLTLPTQSIILCYFGGTGAFLLALQLVYYWKRAPRPRRESHISQSVEQTIINDEINATLPHDVEMNQVQTQTLSASCNIVRLCIIVFFLLCLLGYIFALMWRLNSLLTLVAPAGIVFVLSAFFVYFNTSYATTVHIRIKYLFSSNTTVITVKK